MRFFSQKPVENLINPAYNGIKPAFKAPFCGQQVTVLGCLLALMLPLQASAQFKKDKEKDKETSGRLWITPGAISYHFENRDKFNQRHPSFGLEYEFAPDWAVVAGTYKNSNSLWSKYGGVTWTPLTLGPMQFGATAQIANNYKAARNGKPFPFAAPVMTIESRHFGANVFVVPTIRNVTGAVALQFKFAL